ncbi:hypothetical protein OQA88_9927 [Cercophora sp. LCS_1]
MAAAAVLAPQASLDLFEKQADIFVRRAEPKVKYDNVVGATPVNAFSLNNTHFKKLQAYIAAAFVFPSTSEQFKNKYPFSGFGITHLKEHDHNLMASVLTGIHQHCATYRVKGINPMIELSHSIADFAEDVVVLVNALKEQFEIICDRTVPLGSPQSQQAREDAKELLKIMKQNSTRIQEKSKASHDATSQFQMETEADEAALKGLIETLDSVMPTSMLEDSVDKKMKELRESLLKVVRQQEEAASKAENVSKRSWMCVLPGIGPLLLYNWSRDVDNAIKELRARTEEYNKKLVEGNRQKLELINSADRIRGLSHSITNISKHIADARLCLQNMMDGMARMNATADTLIANLGSLQGRNMAEAPASGYLVKFSVDGAVKGWNTVLQVAREFAKCGLVMDPGDVPPLLAEDKAPTLLAAHYGGQDITTLGKIIFPHSSKVVVNTDDIPISDPWRGVDKSLSLVYTFGNVDTAEKRVFVCEASSKVVNTLTDGAIGSEPSGTSIASVNGNPHTSKSSGVKIYAVIYGKKQITDADVYSKLYNAAARNERVPITNTFFKAEGNNDPWLGKLKSAAIVYTFNGIWKSISGREHESIQWNF